ncbi:MAG: hypothetical protein BGP22_30535, partial [Variovorax sp. 67-131]
MAEPGTLVTVISGTGTPIGSATAAPSGTYAIRPTTPVPDSTVLRVVSTNPAGGTSSEAVTTVDNKAPLAPSVDPTNGSPIAGTAEAGALITIRDGAGNVIGSATAATNGTYSVTPVSIPADGTVLRVVATDAAGNVSQAATTTVDSKPPVAPIVNPTSGSAISGMAEAGALVTIKDSNGNIIGSTTAASNGSYGVVLATVPADGRELRVVAIDRAGNASPETRITVDSKPPLAPTVDPTNGSSITGTAEADAVVTIKDGAGNVIGSATAGSNGAYRITPATKLVDGADLRIAATDRAGNASPEGRVTVDSKPPIAPTVEPTNGSSITGTAEGGALVLVKDSSGSVIGSATALADGKYSVLPATPPEDGSDLRVSATDRAGNTGPEAKIRVDSKAPTAPTVHLTNGSSITGAAEAGTTVMVKDGSNNIIGSTTATADGLYSMSPATVPADGTELRVTAIDRAGNVSPETRGRVDGHLLDTPTVKPTNGSSITGTAGAGALVTIKDNAGAVIGSATVAPDGTYSVTPVISPAHDTELSVVASDPAGKTSPEARVKVDSKPPVAPTIVPTNGSSITGIAEGGTLVAIKDGLGKLIGSTTAAADGSYTVTPSTVMADGTVLHAVATDQAGNVGLEATATVDSKPPAAPTINPTNGRSIAGTAEADALVVIKDGSGKVVGSTTVASDGTYGMTPATALADGMVLHAVATDRAGNAGSEATAIVDSQKPFAPTVNPTNGNSFTGTAEVGSLITIKDGAGTIIGSATTAADGWYNVTPVTPPADGVELSVVATDRAGNASPEIRTTVDSKAPVAPTANPTNGSLITGTAEVGTRVTIKDGTGAVIGSETVADDGKYSITPATRPADGTELRVVATDRAGNASLEARVTVDSKSPNEPTVHPTNGKLITGTAEAGALVTIKDGPGNVIGSATAANDGAYSIAPAATLADGFELRVVATDRAGNASLEIKAIVDGNAPFAPSVDPTDGSLITGTAEANVLVTIKDGTGAVIGSATAGTDGAYGITPTTKPADGAQLRVVASDPAGNASLETRVTVDGMAPAAPTADPTNGSLITGTAEVGTRVTIKDGTGAVIGSATVADDGKYSITPATRPADGTELRVVATDRAGNASLEVRVKVDSKSPNEPTVNPTNGKLITGTAEAGTQVVIKDAAGNIVGSATVKPDGSYSVVPATTPADGTELRVVVTDPAGNVSLEARTIVDGKVLDMPKVDPTNGRAITGTTEAGALVTIKDSTGAVIGSATAAADGTYSIKPVTTPADGTQLSVVATDAAGNASPEARITVDGTPPSAPTVNPTNGHSITGTAEFGALVTIRDGANAVIGSATAAADGSYSVTPAIRPANGAELRIVATDRAGNASLEARVTVDSDPPSAPKVNPTNGNSIAGTAEAHSVVTIKNGAGEVVGSATAAADGSYSITLVTAPTNGTELYVVATDRVGNPSTETRITVDGTPPSAPTVNPTNGSSITGTAEFGALVTVKDGAGAVIGSATAATDGTYSITPTTPPANGTELLVVATDSAGNASTEAKFKVDDKSPVAPTVNPTNGSAITGFAEDGALVTIKDGAGATIGSATAALDGTYSITPATAPADGAELRVVATDRAGNASPEVKVTVDSKPPAAPVVNPTNGSVINGTAEVGALVTIKDGSGATIGSAITAADGTYRVVPATAPADGAQLRVIATDHAGNTSLEAAATVDSNPPPTPTVNLTRGHSITGTAEAGTLVTIKDGLGNAVGSATVGVDGAYTITPAATLTDGTVLHVVAVDRAGNTSLEARTTVDGTPPPAPMLDPSNGRSITGTAEAGALVTINDGAGNVIGSATAAGDGKYSITPAATLADGTVLHAVATDRSGNIGSEATATVDGKEPLAPTVNPTNGSPITGTAELDSIVTIKDGSGAVIGSASVAADGSYRVMPTTPPADGAELSIVATDRAGNASVEVKAIVDGKAPVAPTVNPTNGSAITGSAEDGALVTIKDDAGNVIGSATAAADGKYSITPATAPADGTVLHAVATDRVGNASSAATVTVDRKPPVIGIAIVNDANNDGFINASEKGAKVTVKVTLVSGAAEGDVISLSNGAGTSSITLTATDVANGFVDASFDNPAEGETFSVSATSRDLPGNVSAPAATDSAVLDTTLAAPGIGVASITSDNVVNMVEAAATVVVSGTTTGTQSGDVVTLLVNGVTYSGTVDASGNWRIDVAGSDLAADADRTVAANVVNHDTAGNASSATSNHGYGVSSTAPLVTIDKPVAGDDLVNAREDDAVVVKGATANVENGQTVTVTFSDGTNSVTATATVSGNSWTADPADISGLANGTITITAVVQDLARNPATSTHAVTLDNVVPVQTAEITSYTDDVGGSQGSFGGGTRTDDPNPVLNGKLSAAIGTNEAVRVYEGAKLLGTATVNGTDWTYDLGFLADGSSHTYRAVVAGAGGTEGPMSTDFILTADYALTVNSQNTVDTTPLVTGTMPFKLTDGQYIEVTIDGKTYSSANGVVHIDARHAIWYVQVPAAMASGTYDVKAVVKSASGAQVTTDDTTGELIVSPEPKVTVGATATSPHEKGTAYTVGENGMWRIHSNQKMMDADGTNNATLGSFRLTALKSNSNENGSSSDEYNPTYMGHNYVQNATFMDFNRDGHMDLFTEDSTPRDGQQAFIFNGSSYTALQVGGQDYNYKDKTTAPEVANSNVDSSFSGVVAFDKTGTGFVSVAYGNQARENSSVVTGNSDSQIVLNRDGNIRHMVKDASYTNAVKPDSRTEQSNVGNAPFDTELSGVDLNNDGTIDLVYHATAYTTKIGGPSADPTSASTKKSKEPHRLVVASNKGDGTWENTQIIESVFQNIANKYAFYGNGISMTWADFNGDGYMDLFMGRGYGNTPDAEHRSRILFNDGHGKLEMSDPDDDKIGGMPSSMYTFGKTDGSRALQGGPSLAVDWNGDGKMDAIELPGFGDLDGVTQEGNTGPINLYTNKSSGKTINFERANLLGGSNTIGLWTRSPETNDAVTGAIAADTDWDGDRDLLAFTQKGNTRFITNTTTVADGTSL